MIVLVGLVAGIVGGLLGVGGGVVMIPGMVILLGIPQHMAQGVSLGAMVVTALAGSLTHYRQGNVQLEVALWSAPSAALCTLVGAYLAGMMDAQFLRYALAVLLLFVAGRMFLGR